MAEQEEESLEYQLLVAAESGDVDAALEFLNSRKPSQDNPAKVLSVEAGVSTSHLRRQKGTNSALFRS